MDEKKCKYCAMMIPQDAKICPFCRKKVPTKFYILFAIAATIFTIGTCVAIMGNPPHTTQPQSSSIPTQIALTEIGQKVKKKYPAFSNKICNAIGNKEIFIGMNKDQVIAAWGKPHRINTTESLGSSREQWVMSSGSPSDYLYFEGPMLVSIQQSKSGR